MSRPGKSALSMQSVDRCFLAMKCPLHLDEPFWVSAERTCCSLGCYSGWVGPADNPEATLFAAFRNRTRIAGLELEILDVTLPVHIVCHGRPPQLLEIASFRKPRRNHAGSSKVAIEVPEILHAFPDSRPHLSFELLNSSSQFCWEFAWAVL